MKKNIFYIIILACTPTQNAHAVILQNNSTSTIFLSNLYDKQDAELEFCDLYVGPSKRQYFHPVESGEKYESENVVGFSVFHETTKLCCLRRKIAIQHFAAMTLNTVITVHENLSCTREDKKEQV